MDATQHRPFLDGKFGGLWDSIKHSPYPLHYTLRWPLYFYRPSARNHSGLVPLPARFVHPEADRISPTETLRLVFAGDIMVLNGDRPPLLCPKLCRLIGGSDYFIASLEAPIGEHSPTPDIRYTFKFHMPLAFLESIREQTDLPFDRWVLTNANNHSGDVGADGFSQSIQTLERNGVLHVGWNEGDLYRKISSKGMNVGFAAWTRWLNRDLGAAGRTLTTEHNIASRFTLESKQQAGIDFLIGLPHWEYEFQHFPRRSTRRLARRLLSDGADLLVGSHPHVLQPYEPIGTGHCFYSLGNFCGLGIAWPAKIISLLEVHLARTGPDGAARLVRFAFHHFYQLHVEQEIRIVALDEVPESLRLRAVKRISRVIDHNVVA
ncbi:CapA family protein [Paraburkholderia kururiensis]|uniref:CapA family protein n=1 Tax=Paraburkholderia kururiensis TaxID=984307 RepID=UPI000F8710A2|nr:CapA family protein [Paraburkholderia kururiensis]